MSATTIHVTFKLYASLTDFLPPEAEYQSVRLDVPTTTTVHNLVDRYAVPRKMTHLVLVNGIYIEPEDRDKPLLSDGDTVAIWPPVAGG